MAASEKTRFFKQEWLKIGLLPNEKPSPRCFWSLPKKYIPRAVDRNRLKRYSREILRGRSFSNRLIIVFLPMKKDFYKNLRRRELDNALQNLLDKIQKNGG